MPIQLIDRDVPSQAAGLRSALIVPCNMCSAVNVAVNENKPFLQLFKSLLTSPPLERYIHTLQSRLKENGITTNVFKSRFYHQWLLCIWTAGRRKKLQKAAKKYEAVIVLGCETASETVREAVRSTPCKVIEGMEATGFMNVKPRLRLPCDITLEDCKIIPIGSQTTSQETYTAGVMKPPEDDA